MPNTSYYKNRIRQLREESTDPGFALRQAKASLFFDDDAMLEFLAAERFPNDPLGSLRYQIQDGVIVLITPNIGIVLTLGFLNGGSHDWRIQVAELWKTLQKSRAGPSH